MGKKKKALKARLKKQSKLFMLIFILASYTIWLWTISTIAYADLEICKKGWINVFNNSQWPVGFVLGNFSKK